MAKVTIFLPTPSARRATVPSLPDKAPGVYISTHALREEGDSLRPAAARIH